MLIATIFFDFIRVLIAGDVAEVSRRLAVNPALATMPSDVGATRLGNQAFFFLRSLITFTRAIRPCTWPPRHSGRGLRNA